MARESSVFPARGVRTLLYVPADDPRKCERAWAAGADAIVFDLEDAVPPDGKERARALLAEQLLRRGSTPTVVRINSPETGEGRRDLDLLASLDVDAVMLPKAEPATLAPASDCGVPLVALIETAEGVLSAREVAQVDGVALLCFGPVDLTAELGCETSGVGDELLFARCALVLASAAAGLPSPVDGPCLSLDDPALLEAEAARAKQLGFGGKACIHPRQVEVTRAVFRTSAGDLDWAVRVTRAYEKARGEGAGVAVVDGRMIDAPVARRAYTLLAKAGE